MPTCICCGEKLVQDSDQIAENIKNVFRYYYCNTKACIRYRLLVLP